MHSTCDSPPAHLAVRLGDLARATHGVVTFRELRSLGCSEREIRTMLEKGWLERIRRGVYSVGYRSSSDEARWARITRSCGADAALDAMSSARAWGFARREPPIVQVVAPGRHRPIAGARLRLDRRMDPTWSEFHRGTRLLTPTRTIVRVARFEREERVVAVMREAAYRRRLAMDELLAIAAAEAGKPGIPNLLRSLSLRLTGTAGERSILELAVLDVAARYWPVTPAYNVRVGGTTRRHEVDLTWRDVLIGGEIDGPIHDEPDVRRDDMARDAELTALGWRIFRIHWRAFELDPIGALRPLLWAIADAYRLPRPDLPASRNGRSATTR